MTTSIFAKHNEEVRQAHLNTCGLDILKMTPEQKENHFSKHKVDLVTNQKADASKIIQT